MTSEPAALLIIDAPNIPLENSLPLFRELGYRCTYVPDVAEIVGATDTPEIVIFSGELRGGAHGEDFARLRERFPGVPLVAVAHVRSLTTAIDFFRQGVTDYLLAPLAAEEVALRLELIFEHQQTELEDEPVDVPVEMLTVEETQTASLPAALEQQESSSNRAPEATPGTPAVTFDQENLPCGLLVLDREGNLQQANQAALHLLHCADLAGAEKGLREPVATWEPVSLNGKKISASSWPLFEALKTKTRREATLSLKYSGTTRVWLRLAVLPLVENSKVTTLIVTLTNVTEECAARPRCTGENA